MSSGTCARTHTSERERVKDPFARRTVEDVDVDLWRAVRRLRDWVESAHGDDDDGVEREVVVVEMI